MTISLPTTLHVLILLPLGASVNLRDLALTSEDIRSFHISNIFIISASADTSQRIYLSTSIYISLRICCILLISSLEYPSDYISGVILKSINISPSLNLIGVIFSMCGILFLSTNIMSLIFA